MSTDVGVSARSEYDPTEYPPVALTVDLVVVTIRDGVANMLVVHRNIAPFEDTWALPGGFVAPDESALAAAQRVLSDKTSIEVDAAHLEQLYTYTDPDRDPRMRVVSVAYLCFAPDLDAGEPGRGTDAVSWVPLDEVADLPLAFDHATLAADGIARARAKLSYTTLATSFLSDEFTIAQLRGVYEAVWGVELHPSNFARKVVASTGFVEATDEHAPTSSRPARVYRAGAATELHPPIQPPTPQ